MERKFSKLRCIENNDVITWDTHYELLYHLQHALLLALREQGVLNTMEYRHAEDNLNQQRRDRAKNMLKNGG